MKVLITGANGYIGNALTVACLKNPSYTVTATARRGSILDCKKVEAYKIGNMEDEPNFSKPLKGCDIVFHCATLAPVNSVRHFDYSKIQRINVLGSAHLARQAVAAGVKRFVFISTVEVNGDTTPLGKRFFATSLPRPKRAMGMSMLHAENELKLIAKETGMELVIVRTPMAYGPECSNMFRAIQLMVQFCLPLPLRMASHNERSLIGIDNLVDFLLCVATHPKAANETFLVSDSRPLSTLQIFKLLAETGGKPCLLWPFPTKLLELFNSYIGRQTWGDFLFASRVVDIKKNMSLLNWKPPYSIEQQFTKSWGKRVVPCGEPTSK
ncbi:MAG: NAD-dependent epimerase/dehydratase family protein [Burkholderiales bacterium]|nr:NAD-dependent epimerase/dehydratase family protein [Burkholderiales bacterium]